MAPTEEGSSAKQRKDTGVSAPAAAVPDSAGRSPLSQPKSVLEDAVEEARELERLHREMKQAKSTSVCKERRRHDLGWLGGITGLREILQLQDAYGTRVEFDGCQICLPYDALVVGQAPFINREEESQKAIPLPASERDRPLQSPELLPPAGPGVNWEHWFRLFENELAGRHVSRDRWADMLVNQSPIVMKQDVTSVIHHIRFAGVPVDMVYEAARDKLLKNAGMKYSARTYYKRLHNIVPGSRGARELATYWKELAVDYEAARVRMAREFKRMPEISEYTLTQLYWLSLPATLQDSAPSVDAFRLTNASTLYSSYTSIIIDREAMMQAREGCNRTLIAAAVRVTPDERRKRRRAADGGSQLNHYGQGKTRPSELWMVTVSNVPADLPKGATVDSRFPRGESKEVRCYFCDSPDHSLANCEWYPIWREEDPQRKRLCAKCHRGRHHARFCRSKKGVRWGPPYGLTKTPHVAAVLVAGEPLPSRRGGWAGCQRDVELLSLSQAENANAREARPVRANHVDISTGRERRRAHSGCEEDVITDMGDVAEANQHYRQERRVRTERNTAQVHGKGFFAAAGCLAQSVRNFYLELRYGDLQVQALLDPGSAFTLLSSPPGCRPISGGSPKIFDASGRWIPLLEQCDTFVETGPSRAKLTVYIVKTLQPAALIGLDAFCALGMTLSTVDGELHLCVEQSGRRAPVERAFIKPVVLAAAVTACKDGDDATAVFGSSSLPALQGSRMVLSLDEPEASLLDRLSAGGCAYSSGYDVASGSLSPVDVRPPFPLSSFFPLRKTGRRSVLAASAVVDALTLTASAVQSMCEKAAGLSEEQATQLKRLCMKYAGIWNAGDRPLAETNLTVFRVNVDPTQSPISCAPRPASFAKRQRIAAFVRDCLDKGSIAPSESGWASAVVLASKPGGGDRLCIDYRPLNRSTRVPVYPLPKIHQVFDSLQGKKYFSVFDFPSAYWQVGVEKESRKFLAFITPDGLWKWKRMPCGAAGAPATQQRMIDRLFAGMKWVCAIGYLDDVVIFSSSFDEHLAQLETFFHRVQQANLQLHPVKSRPCQQEVAYLGFLVSAERIRPDPARTLPITRFPTPANKKGVRSFLGIGSYYRRFIKDYARISEPLQRLIPEDAAFKWGEEQSKAFDAIKRSLVHMTQMAHPQPGKEFIIDCDASRLGLGAVISQKDEAGRERPIAFASRVLRPNEQRWSTTELEAFAVVWALKTFRIWIEGSPTLVRTDHSSLLWLRNQVGQIDSDCALGIASSRVCV